MALMLGKNLWYYMKGGNKTVNLQRVLSEVKTWVRQFDYCGNLVQGRSTDDNNPGSYITFNVNTTKTRASSIVTRVGLIVDEISMDREFTVEKKLIGEPPATRDALSEWTITIWFPSLRKRIAA